jgi:gas vesicle protein
MYDRDDSAPALLSFLIGGIVGASLTCLLAPESGIALRHRIRGGVDGGARKGRAAARRLAQAGRAFAGEASEVLVGEGIGTRAARAEAEGASTRRARKVPEPGLPTDMGRGGRG